MMNFKKINCVGFVCCCFCRIVVGFFIFVTLGCWSLEVHSSLLGKNGWNLIGFKCETQGYGGMVNIV